MAGIWKLDFEMASFQLGFDLSKEKLMIWFSSEKLYFWDDRLVIIPFFGFQYGTSKDSWSAKKKAREILEGYGFTIENNRLLIPVNHRVPECATVG